MIMEIPFGAWLPDQRDYKNPGLEHCVNAMPSPNGFQPVLGPVARGNVVSGDIIGVAGFERKGGNRIVAVATTTDLHLIVGGVVSASSLGLSLSGTDVVSFEQYGASIYATTKNGATWRLPDVETSTAFIAASGSPPLANALAVVDDFLIMGDLVDIGGGSDEPYRVRWSQYNNPDGTWGTDIATQSGYQDLKRDQGPVVAISGGSFGLIFQKFGISRIDYTGGGAVFRIEGFETDRGCAAPRSVVRVGSRAFFLSQDGFFETNGAEVSVVSRGRIWSWFTNEVQQAFIQNVQGEVDWPNRCVVWAFSSNDSGTIDRQLYYNWETQAWGNSQLEVDAFVSSGRDGLTLEQVAVLYPNIDTMPISLDSPAFKSRGRSLLAIIDGDLSDLTGDTLEAEFGTGDIQPASGRRSFIDSVTPIIVNESQNTSVSLAKKDTMTASFMQTPYETIGALGFAAFNSDSRYFRVYTRIPAASEWADAFGVQASRRDSGAV